MARLCFVKSSRLVYVIQLKLLFLHIFIVFDSDLLVSLLVRTMKKE